MFSGPLWGFSVWAHNDGDCVTALGEQPRDALGKFLGKNGEASPGRPFEQQFEQLVNDNLDNAAHQVTIRPKLDNGDLADYTVRIDSMGNYPDTGILGMFDAKSSATAGLRGNQIPGYPLIEANGGVVAGANGGRRFPDGSVLPPTKVQIVRPGDEVF